MFDRTLHHDFLVSHRLRLAALASSVALAACGGGSDDPGEAAIRIAVGAAEDDHPDI